MTSLWEYHASPSSNWALAGANVGVLVCDGCLQVGSPWLPNQGKWAGLSFGSLKTSSSWPNLFLCLSLWPWASLCCFWVSSGGTVWPILSLPVLNFWFPLWQIVLRRNHMCWHAPAMCWTENRRAWPLGHGRVKALGMLKLVKLLERRTENRSIDRDPLPLLCNLWLSIISWIKLASVPPAPLFRKG